MGNLSRHLTPDEEDEVLRRCYWDAELYVEEILGGVPDEQQRPILREFSQPGVRRGAVKSGHFCGKDWMAARFASWFFTTRPNSIVVLTGPTERQVRQIAWGEVKSAYQASRWPLGGELLETLWKTGDAKHYMAGYTAADASSMQGAHNESVMVIVTEAQGVKPEMWPAIESLLTAPESKLLLIGNALYEPESEFYTAFTSKSAIYRQWTMDSRRATRCSKEWLQEIEEVHGKGSPYWLARVEGVFPTDISDTLIPLSWIERARTAWGTTHFDVPRTLGVDVARFGSDETVAYLGTGRAFKCVHVAQGQDLMQTVGRIIQLATEYRVPWENVRIDDTGLGGGVTDRLREQGYKVTAINFASAPSEPEKDAGPSNARSELFWSLREFFRTDSIELDPRDQKLLRDLSVLRYKVTSTRGQIKLEDKAEAKRKLGYSPDRADALALAAIPQSVALTLASGAKSNMGLLEYMKQKATQAQAGKAAVPVNVRPMTEVPGAAQALERAHEATAAPRLNPFA